MTAKHPILNQKLADQWFADQDEAEQVAGRSMVAILRAEAGPRLAAFQTVAGTLEAAEAAHELHKLRGAVGSFGFSACSHHLYVLERRWAQLTAAARLAKLKAAHRSFTAGLTRLLRCFPYLDEARATAAAKPSRRVKKARPA